MAKRRFFTTDEVEYIRQNFSKMHTIELANKLNCKQHSVSGKAYQLGLKKDKAVLSDNGERLKILGLSHRFKKGQSPINKGLKQVAFMSEEAIERTKATRFQKGNIPPNHKPIGTERKTKDGYLEVKVAEGLRCWRLKHRIVWEKFKGEIPKGSNIQFRDGNRQNCDISNLYIIKRNQQIEQNSIIRYPTEVRQIIRLVNKITKKIEEI